MGTPTKSRPQHPSVDGLDSAWRIHSSLTDWVARVDGKAAFALSLESAALVAITNLGHASGAGSRAQQTAVGISLWGSALLMVAALAFALTAVVPRTGSRRPTAGRPHDIVYFGHLRHWEADDLAEALTRQELLPALSRQLVVLSRIAWTKHRHVRISLVLAGTGVVLTTVPMMMNAVPGAH